METFIIKQKTKNNIEIHLCAVCEDGFSENASIAYISGIRNTIFSNTKDEYFLDFFLNDMVVKASIKGVLAVGASIRVEGVEERSGGVIGDPFAKSESANDEIDYLGKELYCVAIAGRIGVVFKGDVGLAQIAKDKLLKLSCLENKTAVTEAEKWLKSVSDLYIIVSDGSGDGGYLYVGKSEK